MGNMRHRFSLRRVQSWRIWQASRTRWEQSPVVQRYWTRLGRARVFVALALFAVLFSGVFASAAFFAHAFAPRPAATAINPKNLRSDPRAEGNWFQLSHLGRKAIQPPAARINALRQAATLPHSPLGTVHQTGAANGNVLGAPAGGTWVPLGPQPFDSSTCAPNFCNNFGLDSGRITALTVNPANANDLWAGAADGGIWHSTDGGATWTAMTDTQANLSIGSIAIDPANANIIYVGTGEANFNGDSFAGIGILKTSDGGAHWAQLGFAQFGGLGIGKIAIDPGNSQHLLVAAALAGDGSTPPGGGSVFNNEGIWSSTDGGATWQHTLQSTGFLVAGTEVLFDPVHAGVVYAALGNVFAFTNPDAGVYKSTNGGLTWTQLPVGLDPNPAIGGSNVGRTTLALSPDGLRLYAVIEHNGLLLNGTLFTSADAGATWSAVTVPAAMANNSGEPQWWYDQFIAIDPANVNTVYVGGVDIWQTTTGGAAWTNMTDVNGTNPVHVHPDEHAFVFQPGSSNYYIGNDGGVWSGTSAGVFTNKNAGGLNITQFYGGSIGETGAHAQLYGGAQDNGEIAYPTGAVDSTGVAKQWSESFGGDGGKTAVDYTDNSVVYEEYVQGMVHKSTDGGATWTTAITGLNICNLDVVPPACPPAPDGVNFIMPFVMSASNHNLLIAGTDKVYRSVDGAATWQAISPVLDTNFSAVAVAASNSNVIYAGDNNGDIFITTNGGASWSVGINPDVANFGIVTSLAVDPTNPSVAYAAYSGFNATAGKHLFKTVNAGASWADISVDLPNISHESVAVDPSNHNLVVAGSDAGIFVSQNAGITWAQLGSGLPNAAVNQVFFNHTGDALFVATHGRGMWEFTFPHIQLSAQVIALTGVPGASPASQTLTLSNSGLGPLNWSQTTTLPSWLSLDASSGSIASGANQTLHLTFTIPPTDPAQTYTTTLVFTDPHADNAPMSVPVTLVTANVSTTWYFAEGTTNNGFNEFLTLANPGSVAANVQVKYLLGSGVPVVKSYLVAQNSRATVNVNTELGAGQNVAMVVTSDQPIIAERPMFFTFRGTIPSGTDVLGATALASSFDFGYLDTTVGPAPASHSTWLVLLNQNAFAVDEHIAYFPASGGAATVVTHTVPANSRGTIEVARDVPAGRYSALVTLTQSGTTTAADGLVERVLYQVDSVTGLTGAAAIVGVPAPRASFFFAEGFTTPGPNPRFSERYILSNPCPTSDCVGAATAHATLTFQRTDGSTVSTPVVLAPGQQQIVDAASVLGAGAAVSNSASVTSDQPILAERFMSFHFAPAALGGNAAVGASEAIGAAAPHNLFYFAEGTTNPGFAEFLTIQNPDPTQTATVTVTLLPTTGAPVVRVLSVGPHSRFTLDVNSVLGGQSLSLVVESNVPIVAERPLYFVFRGTLPGGTDVVGYQP